MRAMTSGPAAEGLPKTILGFFYLYFVLHWGTGLLMFGSKIGWSYAAVVRYYRGAPELFMNPRSFAGLLEVTHFHLFAMGFFFVVFCHLLLFTPLRQGWKRGLTWGLAAALLAELAAGWLVRYGGEGFAWLKLAAFWGMQGFCLMLLLGLTAGLARR